MGNPQVFSVTTAEEKRANFRSAVQNLAGRSEPPCIRMRFGAFEVDVTLRELRKPAPEAQASAASLAPEAPPRLPKRGLARPLLFALAPLALVAGGYFYVTGGAVMSKPPA